MIIYVGIGLAGIAAGMYKGGRNGKVMIAMSVVFMLFLVVYAGGV